jgi:hypothetical protein
MKTVLHFMLLLTLFLQACSSDTMARYNIIQGLRTLALIADQPEIGFDGTTFTPSSVNITPVISDLYGGNRSLAYRVYWCLDPGIGLGATPTCDSNPSLVQDASLQNISLSAPSGTFSSPNFTGAIAPINIPLNAAFMGASAFALYSAKYFSLTPAQLYNGYSILVFFELFPTSDPSLKVTTFKRIVFSGAVKTSKNQNPTGLEIRLDGSEIASLPTIEKSLEAHLPSSAAEAWSLMNSGGSLEAQTEKLETTWFLTGPSDIKCSNTKTCTPDGLLSLSRSVPGELNLFRPPQVATPVDRGRILIGIARDDRGGSMMKRYVDGTGP